MCYLKVWASLREMQLDVVWEKNQNWVEDLDTTFVIFILQLFYGSFIKGLIKDMKPIGSYWDTVIIIL